jgi:hypothetical protein
MSTDDLSVVVAVVAIVVSVVSAIHTFSQSRHLASSGFKAAEDLKVDLVTLLAALRSITYKGIAASQDGKPRDISQELERVREFQTSPSGYALAALAAERGAGDGADAGRWRVLGLEFAELAGLDISKPEDAGAALAARSWATEIETTLSALAPGDVDAMARKVSNLPAMIGSMRQTRTQDMVLRLWFDVDSEQRGNQNRERELARLHALKADGVEDPDVDMWIATLTDDPDLLQKSLNSGADLSVTMPQLFKRHPTPAAEPGPTDSAAATGRK